MFNVRRVQPQDIFSVITLAFETLPERYNPVIFNQFYESFPEGFLVAEINHIIIGFIIGVKQNPRCARILMLSIHKNYRRQHIGTALLTKFLEEMQNYQINRIELEVRTTNNNAITFYKKHGFIIQDTLPKFYQNGEDAYHMTKVL